MNNYPNPFNPATLIEYRIADEGFVSLKVYDVLGREIATLVNEEKSAGNYNIKFDASALPTGVYVYSIYFQSAYKAFRISRKMMYLK